MLLKRNETPKSLARMVRFPQSSHFNFQFDEADGRHIWVYEPPKMWIVCKTGNNWAALREQFEDVRGRARILHAAGTQVFVCGLTNQRNQHGTDHTLYFGPFFKLMAGKRKTATTNVEEPREYTGPHKYMAFVETVTDFMRTLDHLQPNRQKSRVPY